MPHFHFHVYDGHSAHDAEGTTLPNLQAAREAAIRMAGAIIRDECSQIGDDWRMEVTDSHGLVLYRIDFTMIKAPATKGRSGL